MAFGVEISNQESPGFQVESLSKLATIFVSFCVLSCRMLPFEDRKDQSDFLSASYPQRTPRGGGGGPTAAFEMGDRIK